MSPAKLKQYTKKQKLKEIEFWEIFQCEELKFIMYATAFSEKHESTIIINLN